MCGIFGIAAHRARIPAGLLERGTASLAHRGPDDSGTTIVRFVGGEIGLGNRRLSILDLSPLGHQPMQDPGNGNWVIYNGEIYNFRELRTELERSGAYFKSQSDTEVILRAYAFWGEDCLSRFRGMFAFALWDATHQHLWIVRDPMGIKPLYYAQVGDFFLFSSEVRSLLGTGLISSQINSVGLVNYLTFGSSYDPFTLLQDVHALPAGHTLTWKDGVVQVSQYWDLIDDSSAQPSRSTLQGVDQAQTGQSIRRMLEEAVRMQLVSDVPVGVFLSGGIDSSALVSILGRGGVTPRTFSIVFKESEFSEAQHSRAIAQKFRTDHHEIDVSQGDVLTAIPDALKAMDLPTMDGINTFFVSRETRRAGLKVALSGLGGDEVFAGYSSFRTVPQLEKFGSIWSHFPAIGRSAIAAAFEKLAPNTDQNRKLALMMSANGSAIHPYFVSRMLFTPDLRVLLFRNNDPAILQSADAPQRDRLNRTLQLDPVNRVSYLESRCYMLNTLLRDSDFMSMSQGLELRVPLIDHQMAKAVLAIPGGSKLNGTPKRLLVEALDGSLPDEVVHRPKRGFTLPFEQWLRQELRSEIEATLDADRVNRGPLGGFLDGHEVRKVWDVFLHRSVSWSRPWALFVLQRWSELYL